MKGEDSAETKLKELDEMHQKYKFMETNLMARKRRPKGQLPDISSSLALIGKLRAKRDAEEDTNTQFLLSDSVYANATIPPTDKVCLRLGANVMLEYSLDDAEDLLKKNKVSAQMTITEVTMARLYNWDVKRRKDKKAAESKS